MQLSSLLRPFITNRSPGHGTLLSSPPADPASATPQRARIVPRSNDDRAVRMGEITPWWRDLYHQALVMPWWAFLLTGTVLYLFANVIFALLYLADPGGIVKARPGVFSDAFFFSIQTMATIGYGVLYPDDLYTNILVTAETLVALLMVALVTGLFFARFSRPTARVRFSENVAIAPRNGVPTLQIRLANGRSNQILQADVELILLRSERTTEGAFMRRFYDLRLERSHTPVFALTFMLMHVIDEASPLYGVTNETLRSENAELLVTVTGLDETMSQTIHARYSYIASELQYGQKFADIFGYLPDGRVAIDLRRFDDMEPA